MQKYPAWRYSATEPAKLIQSIDEEPGQGWADTPAAFTDPLVVDEPEPDPTDPVPVKRGRKSKA